MIRPKLKRDWIGLIVRTLRPMQTRIGTRLPAGSICTVTDSYGGLRLETSKCDHCGVQVTIKDVRESDVEIIERNEKETAARSYMRRRYRYRGV